MSNHIAKLYLKSDWFGQVMTKYVVRFATINQIGVITFGKCLYLRKLKKKEANSYFNSPFTRSPIYAKNVKILEKN